MSAPRHISAGARGLICHFASPGAPPDGSAGARGARLGFAPIPVPVSAAPRPLRALPAARWAPSPRPHIPAPSPPRGPAVGAAIPALSCAPRCCAGGSLRGPGHPSAVPVPEQPALTPPLPLGTAPTLIFNPRLLRQARGEPPPADTLPPAAAPRSRIGPSGAGLGPGGQAGIPWDGVGLVGMDGTNGAGWGWWGRIGAGLGQDGEGRMGPAGAGQVPHRSPFWAAAATAPSRRGPDPRAPTAAEPPGPQDPCPPSRARVPVCGSAPPGPAVPRRRLRGRPPAGPLLQHSPALSDTARGPPAPPGQRSSRPGEDEGPGAAPRAPRAAVTLSRPDRGCGPPSAPEGTAAFQGRSGSR